MEKKKVHPGDLKIEELEERIAPGVLTVGVIANRDARARGRRGTPVSIVTTKPDLKRIVEGVLLSLDLDYSVFDIAEGTDPGHWKVTFFDRYRTAGRSIFDISLTAGGTPEQLKEDLRNQLESVFGRDTFGHTD